MRHEREDEGTKRLMMNDMNDKRRILFVTAVVGSEVHLCMQLHFETNFLLKVIMEEWIISVDTAMSHTLGAKVLLINRMKFSIVFLIVPSSSGKTCFR
jgi:hypothetical protein